MQDTFGAIMIALVNGKPEVLSLKEILKHYLDYQIEIVVRRTRYDLERAKARMHILEGLIIALDNIDETLRVQAPNRAGRKGKNDGALGMSEKKTQAILDSASA
jgi:DNA gyrase subunit A